MNILIDGLYLTNSYLRGIGQYTRTVCRIIDKFNIGDLYVLLATLNYSHLKYLKRHLAGIHYHLIVIPVPGRLFYRLIKHFDFFRILKIIYPIDIVHFPYESLYKTKITNMMTIHGMAPFIHPQESAFENHFRNNVIRSQQFVSGYLTVSAGSKKDILNYLTVSADRIFVIPISIEDYFFNHKRNRNSLKDLNIFYYGGFEKNKNHSKLISALDRIENERPFKFTLHVIGHDKWSMEESNDYLQKPYVKMMGYLNQQEMIEKLQSAACVILPSVYEGYGLPVIESLALGIPVLVSETVYALDYVEKGYITFNPFSVDDMVKAVISFSRNRMQLESDAQAESDQIKNQLNFSKMAERLNQTYRDILRLSN